MAWELGFSCRLQNDCYELTSQDVEVFNLQLGTPPPGGRGAPPLEAARKAAFILKSMCAVAHSDLARRKSSLGMWQANILPLIPLVVLIQLDVSVPPLVGCIIIFDKLVLKSQRIYFYLHQAFLPLYLFYQQLFLEVK